MSKASRIAALRQYLPHPLSESAMGDAAIAGVLGDNPSRYSKSPSLWNAAFRQVGIRAVYFPFDVEAAHVGPFLTLLKTSEQFLGVNVTVPHKIRVIDFLDELDAGAKRIGAVNTVVRTAEGRLIGYNTDGEGFIESLLGLQPGRSAALVPSLRDTKVLLLGAGGSARAVAFHVAELIGEGSLIIANRTLANGAALAVEAGQHSGRIFAIPESQIPAYAPRVDLVINSTTKGQGGLRKLPGDKVTCLEPYSCLAPADPPVFSRTDAGHAESLSLWPATARADVERNQAMSMNLAKSVPEAVPFYDLIYHPEETVFLRHGRLTGHPTMNGKAMIVNQAAIAFCRICSGELKAKRIDSAQAERRILETMYAAW